MSSTPFVSVLVTVHNREKYLRETLDSIRASSFADFEVVVVDDASSDRSLEIATKTEAEDPRFRVYSNAENLGDYGNRMKAASLARGHYLKYVDSDDLIYPHGLQVMVDAVKTFPQAAVGLAHSMPEDEHPYPWLLSPQQAYKKHFLGRGCMSCGPTGAIIRKNAFESVGGFRKEWGILSDSDLWYRLASNHPIMLLPPALVWWRRHEDQEFTKSDAAFTYLRRGFELDTEHLSLNPCPLSRDQQARAMEQRRHRFARTIVSLGTKGRQPLLAKMAFQSSNLTLSDLLAAWRRN